MPPRRFAPPPTTFGMRSAQPAKGQPNATAKMHAAAPAMPLNRLPNPAASVQAKQSCKPIGPSLPATRYGSVEPKGTNRPGLPPMVAQPKQSNAPPPPTKFGVVGMAPPFSGRSVQMMESAGKRNPPVNYTGMAASSRSYHPQPNPDYNIPQRAIESINEEYKNDRLVLKVSGLTSRTSFPSNHTQGMIDFIEDRDDKYRTSEDDAMIQNPSLSLKDEGISRNHKLADSSIRAIVVGIWAFLKGHNERNTKPTLGQLDILLDFFKALQPDDADPKDILDYLYEATEISSPYKIIPLLNSAIELLSMDYKNLRFGNAVINEEIVYAFDPNVHTDGSLTPLSERILRAGQRLENILPKQAIVSAFTQATSKTIIGKKIVSSSTLF